MHLHGTAVDADSLFNPHVRVYSDASYAPT